MRNLNIDDIERDPPRITAGRLKTLVALRHPIKMGEWAVVFELRNGTGFHSNTRSIDVFAINCWPSKKFTRVGYEVKVNRNDWIRESNYPQKSEWAREVCEQFFYVSPADVIFGAEVPVGCGLLHVTRKGNKLRTIKAAALQKGRDFTMPEWASLIRSTLKPMGSVRWQYAGKELTEEDLIAMLEKDRDYLEQREIWNKANAERDRLMEKFDETRGFYARALLEAGCKPPPFLKGTFTPDSVWSADQWVKQNVRPGPNWRDLDRLRQELKQTIANLESTLSCLPRSSPE